MWSKLLIIFGVISLLIGVFVLILTFLPVIENEIQYNKIKDQDVVILEHEENTVTGVETLLVEDSDFGIVIPKIRANASVIQNVDPNDRDIYQRALTRGVAHASGTPLPEEGGNTFIFSHSSVNFFDASRYNSIFYLLNKLENGDEIFIYRNGDKYSYSVVNTALVDPDEVRYMQSSDKGELTLMTCWPAGTTYKRLIVSADLL
ncbi:sortase [Patescibacteria group bacterium]